jgi:hypothetical protein
MIFDNSNKVGYSFLIALENPAPKKNTLFIKYLHMRCYIADNVKAYPTLRLLFGAMCRSAAFYVSRRGGQATAGSAAGYA